MSTFDDDKKKKNPFDDNMDDFFKKMFDNILNDDRFQDEISRMMDEVSKMYGEGNPKKPFFKGFKVEMNPDGSPHIEEFSPPKKKAKPANFAVERKPCTDVLESDHDIAVTLEIPDVSRDQIDVRVTEKRMVVEVNDHKKPYRKVVEFSSSVEPEKTTATYKNGILDVVIQKKDAGKQKDEFQVSID